MIEPIYIETPQTRPAWEPRVIVTHEVAPDERLHVDPSRDTSLSVVDGVVYAAIGDDDYVMTPGDRVAIPAGAAVRVWNAGDEVARVVTERA
jgi:mannose-6-phosphate isomerase-like protein (cupin superfamily)